MRYDLIVLDWLKSEEIAEASIEVSDDRDLDDAIEAISDKFASAVICVGMIVVQGGQVVSVSMPVEAA